jgi:hypothetical protein
VREGFFVALKDRAFRLAGTAELHAQAHSDAVAAALQFGLLLNDAVRTGADEGGQFETLGNLSIEVTRPHFRGQGIIHAVGCRGHSRAPWEWMRVDALITVRAGPASR